MMHFVVFGFFCTVAILILNVKTEAKENSGSECTVVFGNMVTGEARRCENEEVVCYHTSKGGLSCKFKDQK